MRRLDKVKPSGKGIAQALPESVGGGKGYYNLVANQMIVYEEFPGTAISDGDGTPAEWADASTNGTGGAAGVTFSGSMAIMDTSTGTAGTAIQRIRSAISSNTHLYSAPFRVTFWARISCTAGAGISPSNLTTGVSCLYAKLGIRDTGETHIAQFNLDLSTAGGTSLASPVVNLETRSGSTAAAFINSAAHIVFSTSTIGMNRTATSLTGYSIEITHRGVSFGVQDDRNAVQPPQLLSHFGNAVPALNKAYFIDASITADGTGGYTQTDGVQLEIDSIVIEQLTPEVKSMREGLEGMARDGGIRALLSVQALPSATLVTAGAGLFHGVGWSTSATAGADVYYAAYDASAAGSSVYDFSALPSTGARLIWYAQLMNNGSAGSDAALTGNVNPPVPLPFYRGLVVGAVALAGTSAGSTAVNVCTVFSSQR